MFTIINNYFSCKKLQKQPQMQAQARNLSHIQNVQVGYIEEHFIRM